MRSLLARLPFTFLIVGGWLGYMGYRGAKGLDGPVTTGRIAIYFVASVLALSLAMAAFRERHRRHFAADDDQRLPPL